MEGRGFTGAPRSKRARSEASEAGRRRIARRRLRLLSGRGAYPSLSSQAMDKREATVTWRNELVFDAQVGSHTILFDSAAAAGPSPKTTLLAAVAGCTAMDVMAILRKQRQPVTGLVVRAEGPLAEDHPKRFTEIQVVYEVHGPGVSRQAVERAVTLSQEKYCSVSDNVRRETSLTYRIELVDDGGGDPAAPTGVTPGVS